MKIGILGANGTVGKEALQSNFITHAVDKKPITLIDGSKIATSTQISTLLQTDAIIDFSATEATINLLEIANDANYQGIIVICVTGFTSQQIMQAKILSKNLKVAKLNNTSLGMILTLKALRSISAALPKCDIDIIEKHRKGKKDLPSGTALAIAKAIEESSSLAHVTTHSVRAADIIGDHLIEIRFDDQTLIISHSVNNRRCFAKGAIEIATKLANIHFAGFIEDEQVIELLK